MQKAKINIREESKTRAGSLLTRTGHLGPTTHSQQGLPTLFLSIAYIALSAHMVLYSKSRMAFSLKAATVIYIGYWAQS